MRNGNRQPVPSSCNIDNNSYKRRNGLAESRPSSLLQNKDFLHDTFPAPRPHEAEAQLVGDTGSREVHDSSAAHNNGDNRNRIQSKIRGLPRVFVSNFVAFENSVRSA